jgi:ABC-type transport system substrate-binding protein
MRGMKTGRGRALMRFVALSAVVGLVVTACAPADDPEEVLQDTEDDADDVADTDDDDADDTAADDDAAGDIADDERFTIAVGVDFDTFDPAGTTTTTVGNMVTYMVETLTRIDEEGEVLPQLATDWEIADDGLTYTLSLVEDATFHDGTPFNADAVVFTMDRVRDPEVEVPIRAAFEAIESVTAIDEYTVEIALAEPFPPLLAALSFEGGAIISPDSVEAEGNSYTDYTQPVGTGPYVYGEYNAGENFQVSRYDDYWGELPYYSDVTFQIVPESATRVSLLRAGQADMIILPPISDLPALDDADDTELLLAPGNRTIFMAINNNTITDPLVRQAMNLAVDRQAIIDNVLFGAADPVDAPMDESLVGYCSVRDLEYDPDQARELLAEAGAEDLEIDFIAPTGRYVQDAEVAQAVSGFLEEVGISVNFETMDWPTYVGRITAEADDQEQDVHLLGWAPSYLDSFQHMVIFQSNQAPPNGLGTAFYDNSEVDDILASAAVEVDEDARQQLYCDASEIIFDEAPHIFMYSQRFPIAYSADVTDVSFRPNESFYAIYARPAS